MIGQKKISSFFSPQPAKKRPADGENGGNSPDGKVTPVKKLKADDSPTTSPPGNNGLSPEQRARMEEKRKEALGKLANKNCPADMGETWRRALAQQFSKPYWLKLMSFVQSERASRTVYPPANQVFTWTQMCTIQEVKVVILGQDPYHGPGQAHGLCFSVQRPVPPPPSLVNMYKELQKDVEGFEIPNHGDLTGWAKQGVLLLNAVLTVRKQEANSHKGQGWEEFTDAVITWLNKNGDGIVFMLWGAYAQKKGSFINKKKHHVLKAPHPSPLSAHRGFLGCGHFSKTNELLKSAGKTPINWSKLS
ncbi:uracil-DNA glycosylase-like [Branchiostoma floridae x Branchiostoma belcheri]